MAYISQPTAFPAQKRKPIVFNDLSQLSGLLPLPPIFDYIADVGAHNRKIDKVREILGIPQAKE